MHALTSLCHNSGSCFPSWIVLLWCTANALYTESDWWQTLALRWLLFALRADMLLPIIGLLLLQLLALLFVLSFKFSKLGLQFSFGFRKLLFFTFSTNGFGHFVVSFTAEWFLVLDLEVLLRLHLGLGLSDDWDWDVPEWLVFLFVIIRLR